MKSWQHVLLGFLAGMIISAMIIVVVGEPRGVPIQLMAAPTAKPFMIDISGAVATPGIYELLPGSRLRDAVTAAGGLSEYADRDQVNLARLIMDGEKIYIPVQGEILLRNDIETTRANNPLASNGETGKININTATQDQLELLPGIGKIRALQIIKYREEHGYFLTLDEIMNIPGIGTELFNQIKDMIVLQ